MGIVISIIVVIINNNISEIIRAAPEYQKKLQDTFEQYTKLYGVDDSFLKSEIIERIDIPLILSSLASIITLLVKNIGIILFFTIFILLESTSFKSKLALITG